MLRRSGARFGSSSFPREPAPGWELEVEVWYTQGCRYAGFPISCSSLWVLQGSVGLPVSDRTPNLHEQLFSISMSCLHRMAEMSL